MKRRLTSSPHLLVILFLAALSVQFGRADSDDHKEPESGEHAEVPTGVGPTKAVTEASTKLGIKLSDQAIQMLELKTAPAIFRQGGAQVPRKGILSYQAERGVYRLREGWFKLVEVKLVNQVASTDALVLAPELKPGDQVVTEGAALLRLAELNVWAGDEGGE